MKLLYIIFLTGSISCLQKKETDLIATFLKENDTKYCFFLVCWKNSDKLRMNKVVIQEKMDISLAFLSTKERSLSKALSEHYSKITYILDLSCEKSSKILLESSKTAKFMITNSWMILAKHATPLEDIRKLFDKIEMRMDMDVKIAIPRNYGNQYDIYEIYDPGLGVNYKLNVIGFFSDGRLSYEAEKTFFKSRMNMTGVLIRNANSVNFTPELLKKSRNLLHYEEPGGLYSIYLYHLFQRFKELMKFHDNTTISYPWFGYTDNGTDAGLGQLIYNNTVDIQTAGGSVIPSRITNFEPLVIPYLKVRTNFFYRSPGIKKPGAQVMKPLDSKVWYCTLGTIVITGATIKLIYWIENKFLNDNDMHNFFTYIYTLFIILTQQGSAIFPQNTGSRIVILNFSIFSIWIYNYYTSALLSSLLNSKPQMLTSYRDLYESHLKVAMQEPYHVVYVNTFNDRDLEELFEKKIYNHSSHKPNYFPIKQGVEKVRHSDYAYNAFVTSAYVIISNTFDQDAICDLGEISFLDFFGAMFLQKKSQYKDLFLIGLTKLWENGITLQTYDHLGVKKPECRSSLLFTAVGPEELFLVYLFFVVGVVLALVILFAEIWYQRMQTKTNAVVSVSTN